MSLFRLTEARRQDGFIRISLYVLAGGLVLLAVLLTALRLALGLAPEFRQGLTAWVSDAVGHEVHVGSFSARLHGLKLHLVLNEVRLGPEDEAGLELGELRLALNTRESLRHRDLRLGDMIVSGLELTAERQPDGRLNLVGIGPRELDLPPLELLDDLLLQPFTVVLEDAGLRLHDIARGRWHVFPELEARLLNLEDGRRQLSGRLQGTGHWMEQLAFIAEWGGAGVASVVDAPVDYYLTIRGLRTRLVEELLTPAGQVPYVAGSGDVELWGRMDAGLPGLGGETDQRGLSGSVQVQARSGELVFPRLFRAPIPHDHVHATARWRLDADGWQVDVDEARGGNEDGDVAATVRVAQRRGDPGPFLDIRAHAEGRPGNAHHTGRYLPAFIMPPVLVDWLDRAIAGGTAPRADVIFFGHARDFPFEGGQGVFRVEADARDVTLDYWPGWPAVEALNGRLLFNAREMRILADAGTIGGVRAEQAEARIPVLGKTPLAISGRFLGQGDDLLGFLRAMPLTGQGLGQVLDQLRLGGEHRLDLGLVIPFHGLPVEVDGAVSLHDGTLRWLERDLLVESLRGEVHFDQFGVRSDRVTGRLAGAEVHLDTETLRDGDSSRIRLVAGLSGLPVELIAQQIPTLDFLQGDGDFRIQADLPGFRGPPPSPLVELEFRSDLRGVASRLPAPVDKAADDVSPFSLRFGVGEGGAGPIRFQVGERLSGVLLPGPDGRPERMGLRLGGGSATLPPAQGLHISGHAPEVGLDDWVRWLGQSADRTANGLPLQRLDITAGTLLIRELALPDVSVLLTRDNEDWELLLGGSSVSGEGRWSPLRGGLLRAHLNHLRLPTLPPAIRDTGQGDTESPALWPDQWPFAEVRIRRLYYQDNDVGRVELDAEPVDGGYRMNTLLIEGSDFSLRADGEWRADRERGNSRLSYRLRSENLGATASALGYADLLREGRGRASGDLSWAGLPTDYGLEVLEGDLRATLRDGRLLLVEPGAGRLLGLFSVALLPRRLMMNFSDVVEEGFAFDTIRADLKLEGGVIEPRQLVMSGPAAQVEVSGRLDLVQRAYDQTVLVAPRTSGTLPLIGGLLGGPPVAAALLVTQQVFRDTLDRAVGAEYRVTGPFNDPDIERIQRGSGDEHRRGPDPLDMDGP
ncbi:MAG: TIGR02099 family protein [Ectothiorhodospiraceae bacterium]|nr:TIGR02099 family protein [Ectothiorhodospiraceae bacterium]